MVAPGCELGGRGFTLRSSTVSHSGQGTSPHNEAGQGSIPSGATKPPRHSTSWPRSGLDCGQQLLVEAHAGVVQW